MGKISTYPVVSTPASLSDMLIGTDISANNETENFEISQILSLYPLVSPKAQYSSYNIQNIIGIGTPTPIRFETTDIQENGITIDSATHSIISFNKSGYFLVQLSVSVYADDTENELSMWATINNLSYGSAHIESMKYPGYRTIFMSWIINVESSSDTLQLFWSTSDVGTTLQRVVSPAVASSQLIITQI